MTEVESAQHFEGQNHLHSETYNHDPSLSNDSSSPNRETDDSVEKEENSEGIVYAIENDVTEGVENTQYVIIQENGNGEASGDDVEGGQMIYVVAGDDMNSEDVVRLVQQEVVPLSLESSVVKEEELVQAEPAVTVTQINPDSEVERLDDNCVTIENEAHHEVVENVEVEPKIEIFHESTPEESMDVSDVVEVEVPFVDSPSLERTLSANSVTVLNSRTSTPTDFLHVLPETPLAESEDIPKENVVVEKISYDMPVIKKEILDSETSKFVFETPQENENHILLRSQEKGNREMDGALPKVKKKRRRKKKDNIIGQTGIQPQFPMPLPPFEGATMEQMACYGWSALHNLMNTAMPYNGDKLPSQDGVSPPVKKKRRKKRPKDMQKLTMPSNAEHADDSSNPNPQRVAEVVAVQSRYPIMSKLLKPPHVNLPSGENIPESSASESQGTPAHDEASALDELGYGPAKSADIQPGNTEGSNFNVTRKRSVSSGDNNPILGAAATSDGCVPLPIPPFLTEVMPNYKDFAHLPVPPGPYPEPFTPEFFVFCDKLRELWGLPNPLLQPPFKKRKKKKRKKMFNNPDVNTEHVQSANQGREISVDQALSSEGLHNRLEEQGLVPNHTESPTKGAEEINDQPTDMRVGSAIDVTQKNNIDTSIADANTVFDNVPQVLSPPVSSNMPPSNPGPSIATPPDENVSMDHELLKKKKRKKKRKDTVPGAMNLMPQPGSMYSEQLLNMAMMSQVNLANPNAPPAPHVLPPIAPGIPFPPAANTLSQPQHLPSTGPSTRPQNLPTTTPKRPPLKTNMQMTLGQILSITIRDELGVHDDVPSPPLKPRSLSLDSSSTKIREETHQSLKNLLSRRGAQVLNDPQNDTSSAVQGLLALNQSQPVLFTSTATSSLPSISSILPSTAQVPTNNLQLATNDTNNNAPLLSPALMPQQQPPPESPQVPTMPQVSPDAGYSSAQSTPQTEKSPSVLTDMYIHNWRPTGQYRCVLCSYSCVTKNYLFRHWLVHHNNELFAYRCPYCDFRYTYKDGVTRHVGRWHKEKAKEVLVDIPVEDEALRRFKALFNIDIQRERLNSAMMSEEGAEQAESMQQYVSIATTVAMPTTPMQHQAGRKSPLQQSPFNVPPGDQNLSSLAAIAMAAQLQSIPASMPPVGPQISPVIPSSIPGPVPMESIHRPQFLPASEPVGQPSSAPPQPQEDREPVVPLKKRQNARMLNHDEPAPCNYSAPPPPPGNIMMPSSPYMPPTSYMSPLTCRPPLMGINLPAPIPAPSVVPPRAKTPPVAPLPGNYPYRLPGPGLSPGVSNTSPILSEEQRMVMAQMPTSLSPRGLSPEKYPGQASSLDQGESTSPLKAYLISRMNSAPGAALPKYEDVIKTVNSQTPEGNDILRVSESHTLPTVTESTPEKENITLTAVEEVHSNSATEDNQGRESLTGSAGSCDNENVDREHCDLFQQSGVVENFKSKNDKSDVPAAEPEIGQSDLVEPKGDHIDTIEKETVVIYCHTDLPEREQVGQSGLDDVGRETQEATEKLGQSDLDMKQNETGRK